MYEFERSTATSIDQPSGDRHLPIATERKNYV